jgi:hypothetical protein
VTDKVSSRTSEPAVRTDLAGVALAAGLGTRLRPLTYLRPKALCPVGGVPLVDLALDRLSACLVDPPAAPPESHCSSGAAPGPVRSGSTGAMRLYGSNQG